MLEVKKYGGKIVRSKKKVRSKKRKLEVNKKVGSKKRLEVNKKVRSKKIGWK